MADAFVEAGATLSDTSVAVADFGNVVKDLLPVDGASVSTLGPLLSSATLSATDALALRIDELQFDLGEGPCWDAISAAAPVIMEDVPRYARDRWPAFSEAIAREAVASLMAFPISFGPLRLGAVDVYATTPVSLTAPQVRKMTDLMTVLGRRVLEHALRDSTRADNDLEPDPGDRFSRRAIHQATGAVLAQLNVTPDDAHLLIQGHAFATHQTMAAVADDVLGRRLRFRQTDAGIITEEGPDE